MKNCIKLIYENKIMSGNNKNSELYLCPDIILIHGIIIMSRHFNSWIKIMSWHNNSEFLLCPDIILIQTGDFLFYIGSTEERQRANSDANSAYLHMYYLHIIIIYTFRFCALSLASVANIIKLKITSSN